jgi:protein-tyrosine phosphatase
MPSILFVCTANQFRSPLAAGIMLNYLEQKNMLAEWKVESAGTWTTDGLPALLVARQNAKRLGLKGIDQHLSRQVSSELIKVYDLIVVMESGHKEALMAEFKNACSHIYMLSEIIDGQQIDIADPIVLGLPTEEIANELFESIQHGADKIMELAQTLSFDRKQV